VSAPLHPQGEAVNGGRRARIWKAANGDGWICHEQRVYVIDGHPPFWAGGIMRWAKDWRTVLGWAVKP
jgi:hypothetical protein